MPSNTIEINGGSIRFTMVDSKMDELLNWLGENADKDDRDPEAPKVKLSDVIKIWDKVHIKNTGDLGYTDMEKAIEEIVGIHNDIPH